MEVFECFCPLFIVDMHSQNEQSIDEVLILLTLDLHKPD